MNPLLFLLLKNICVFEKIINVENLLFHIKDFVNDNKNIEHNIALFVVVYYATASTKIGHMAAGHGAGLRSIDKAITIVERYKSDQIDKSIFTNFGINLGEDILLFQ